MNLCLINFIAEIVHCYFEIMTDNGPLVIYFNGKSWYVIKGLDQYFNTLIENKTVRDIVSNTSYWPMI